LRNLSGRKSPDVSACQLRRPVRSVRPAINGGALTATVSPKARSILLVWLGGGPSHLDLFDPKPKAPAEYRGPFAARPAMIIPAGIPMDGGCCLFPIGRKAPTYILLPRR
jgi:Protein of unknown function (DUF1501)